MTDFDRNELAATIEKIQNQVKETPWLDLSLMDSQTNNPVRSIIGKLTTGLSDRLCERIEQEYFGFGPIRLLMDDPTVTEIIVNGPSSIWFEQKGCLVKYSDQFFSELSFRNFIHFICRKLQIPYSLERPFICGNWGNFRIHIAGEGATQNTVLVTIRKLSSTPWSLEKLRAANWCGSEQMTLLKTLVQSRQNLLIVGATGSGKTSLLSALLGETAECDRVLILEDTNELSLPNGASTKILTREDPQRILPDITLADLTRQALRMRPDRIVLGEVRGPEAKELLLALSTGHSGSMGTLHAHTPVEALLRLEMLIQLGAPQWSLNSVRRLIYSALNVIVVAEKTNQGERKLRGIYRIAGLEDFGLLTEQLG